MNKLKSFKKGIEDIRQGSETALEASKKELTSIPELPELGNFSKIPQCSSSYSYVLEISDSIP